MMKRLSLLGCLYVLLALAIAPLAITPQTAEAQFAPTTDASIDVVWSLDPRDFPDLFDHGGDTGVFGARSVLTGMDLDGDGNKEFLFTTDETLAPGGPDPGFLDVYLYENNGDDSYEYVWHYTMPEGTNSLPALAHGDLDNDGLNEIYFGVPTLPGGTIPADLFIFEQNPDGTFPDEPTVAYDYERDQSLDFRPAAFAIADVDGDGQQELVTGSRTGGNRELVVISPDAGIDAFATFTIEFEAGNDLLGGGSIYDVDVFDFDGDGNMEIWISTWDKLSMTVFEASGPDTYALQADINQASDATNGGDDLDHGSFNSHKILFSDVDGNGSTELVWPTTSGVLFILESLDDVANLTGDDFVRLGAFGGRSRGGDVGDLDGDGLTDIVVGTGTQETIERIEYQGGSVTDSSSYAWTRILDSTASLTAERFYPLRIADDLDGDGLNEIVMTNLFASESGQPLIAIAESTGLTTDTEERQTPDDFVLEGNYPNPFTASTTIDYALKTSDEVTVRVYDMMGREVRTLLASQTQIAGRHQLEWDGRNEAGARVASGTYLYTLEVGGLVQSRVMTLLK